MSQHRQTLEIVALVLLFLSITLLAVVGFARVGVELTGLYWHFVDLVWVFIFTSFYLI